jgi:hypothetical protein
MVSLGISVDESTCDSIIAYLGSAKSEYRFCEIRETESD